MITNLNLTNLDILFLKIREKKYKKEKEKWFEKKRSYYNNKNQTYLLY